jgi:hypothetical protein
MTSTLIELSEIIWQRLHNGEDMETITNRMVLEHPEFSEDTMTNLVKSIYLKDFKTD